MLKKKKKYEEKTKENKENKSEYMDVLLNIEQ